MRIGFDLDQVLYDFVECSREACRDRYDGRPGVTLDAPATIYDYWVEWGLTTEEFWTAVREDSETFSSQPLDQRWLDVLSWVRDNGHTAHIVTARTLHRANTIGWLERVGIYDLFESIHFTADKTIVDVDVLIDDSPHIFDTWSRYGIVWDHAWNREVWRATYRARSHDDLIKHLERVAVAVDQGAETQVDFERHETILEEAQRLIYGNRQQDYGHPIEDFTRTGRIWGGILADWARATSGDEPVPPELVGLCMIGVKLSREVNAPKRDNLTDAAGYAGTVAMIRERQQF